jgi:hypothetical protein
MYLLIAGIINDWQLKVILIATVDRLIIYYNKIVLEVWIQIEEDKSNIK